MSEPEKKPFSVKQAILPAGLALFFLGVFAACLFSGKFGFVYNFVKDFFSIEIGLAASISSLAAAVAVFTLFIALPSMICRKILARNIHQGISLSIGYICALMLGWYPWGTNHSGTETVGVTLSNGLPHVNVEEKHVSELEESTVTLPGGVPMVMIKIPSGSFQMGSPETETSRASDEGPVHLVTISNDFYLGKYELTQQQWLALMGKWPNNMRRSNLDKGDKHPANCISWNDCQNFIVMLNKHISSTGQGPATFRLPNEAEWEYACRAKTQTRFFFGDSLIGDDAADGPAGTLPGNRSDYAWFSQKSTHPVGARLPNQYGLHDIGGNVWEWCQDYYNRDYIGAPADGNAWVSPARSRRVLRGGGNGPASDCRSGNRFRNLPDSRDSFFGVRLARSL